MWWWPKMEDNARVNGAKLMNTGAACRKIKLLAGISWSQAYPPLWRILRSLALTTAVLIIFLSNHLVAFGPNQAGQSKRSREKEKGYRGWGTVGWRNLIKRFTPAPLAHAGWQINCIWSPIVWPPLTLITGAGQMRLAADGTSVPERYRTQTDWPTLNELISESESVQTEYFNSIESKYKY